MQIATIGNTKLDKIDIKIENVTRDKKGHFIMERSQFIRKIQQL